MKHGNYSSQPLSVLIQELKQLCEQKMSGTLFIITDDKYASRILLMDGNIIEISLGYAKGEKALALLCKVINCRFQFFPYKHKKPVKATQLVNNSDVFKKLSIIYKETKSTILIVDDEPVNLSILTHILSGQYRVRAANSGKCALQIAGTTPKPDLILLDIMMPDMDGYAVLAQLKEVSETKHIPVIFVTAMDAETGEERGFKMGIVDYIAKLIHPDILLARVNAQLILKQASDFLHDKNTYLEAEINRRMKENLVVQNVTIRALAHLAETRDPQTGEHILRTQYYVELLARQLQSHPRFEKIIDEEYINLLTRSAPLHDIGKVGIPDNILLKPGKLTAQEWDTMKTHTILGAKAIEEAEKDVEQPLAFLSLAKEIAHWHHEKWDGSGYPDGLSGDQIPLSARLMALVDVFDALTMKRTYKEAFSLEKAKKMVLSVRGIHFDPDIVDAFINCYKQFINIATQYNTIQFKQVSHIRLYVIHI